MSFRGSRQEVLLFVIYHSSRYATLMSSGRAIAKNAAWLMMATTGQKLIAFFAFTAAARIVGRDVTGEYFFAIAVTSTFVILSDLGLTPVVIRAIASGAEEWRRFLGAAFRLKVGMIPIAVVAALGYVVITGALGGGIAPVILLTTAIACLAMGADAVQLLLYGALRGLQRLQYEAVGMITGQVLTATVAISAALAGWGAPGLALALFAASGWNVAWALFQTRRNRVTSLKPRRADFVALARQAVPFALAGLFVKVYSYLDTLMLERFYGTDAVGTYSVPYKITYAFQFIPLVFTAALYPALSSVYANGDRDGLKRVFAGSLRLMVVVGAPLAAGLSAIAPWFIPLVYGNDFLPSVPVLTVLPWVLLPIFLDFPVGSLLNATHRAHLKTGAMGATMVLNAALNLLLVPRMGPVGAAWAAVGSFWFLLVMGLWFSRSDMPGGAWLASLLARSALVAGGVWLAARLAYGHVWDPLTVLPGIAAAIVLLFLTRLATIQDVRMALRWFRRKVGHSGVSAAGS